MKLFRLSVLSVGLLGALALTAGAAPVSPDARDKMEPSAQKLKKGLDQVKEFDIDKQGITKALEMLREQTGLPIEAHPSDLINPAILLGIVPGPMVGGPAGGVGGDHPELTIKGKMKVRTALRRALEPHGITFVILDDKILLTSVEMAPHRQTKQKVNVSFDNVKLAEALKQLGKETAANIVLDPKAAKEGETSLSLDLEEVALDAAVKVLAASAGLSSVRLGNVLYVTTGARAKELRAEAVELQPPTSPMQQYMNMNLGMFGLAGGGIGAGVGGGLFGIGGGVPGAAPAVEPMEAKPAEKGEKKEEKKEEKKKEEKKKDDDRSSLDQTTGMMAAATVGLLLVTSLGAWRRRCRREGETVG